MNQKPVNNTFMSDCWPKDCVSGGHMASDPMYHTPSVQCPAVQVLKGTLAQGIQFQPSTVTKTTEN